MPTELVALAAAATLALVEEKPPAAYRWYFGDLRTGKISHQTDLIGYRWSTAIGDAGSLDGSFPLRSGVRPAPLGVTYGSGAYGRGTYGSGGPRRGDWPSARSDAAPAKQFMAVAYVNAAGDETFLAGGPIWTAKFTDSTGVLQIGAAGLKSYFDHRKVIPVLAAGANPATASVTYDTAQLGLIAKRLVELSQSHTGGSLPIVLPSDADLGGAGTTHTRTYPGYELGWVGERLKQLSEVEDGPEISFTPRRRTDDLRFIEWVMRIGVAPTMILTQSGAPWVFDRTVPKSSVKEIDVDSDGSKMAFRVWAAGQGEAEGRPIIFANNPTLPSLGWPLLESEVTATDTVTTTATLQGHATEELTISASPIETWTVTVARDGRPNVGQYGAGDWVTVRLRAHLYLPDGDYSMRILSVSGDTSGDVTLALTPRLAAV